MQAPHTIAVPWPVPRGWRFFAEDEPEPMPTIERDIGGYTVTVGDDGPNGWRWWLCPKGSLLSVKSGEATGMLDGICQVLDALADELA